MEEKICGIYSITNKINNKIYIGSSYDIYKRWIQHKKELKAQKHHSKHLQNAWNKYGEDNFIFKIIEICSMDDLLNREQYYIDLYESYKINKGYNISPYANRPFMTDEQKRIVGLKQSINLRGENCYSNIYTEEQITKLIDDLKTGQYSYVQLSEKYNISYDVIASVAIHGTWKYLTKDIEFPKAKLSSRSNVKLNENMVLEIIQLILAGKGNFEIAEQYNVHPHTISDIRNHKTWIDLTKDLTFRRVRRNKGFGNEKSKLSEQQVKEIKVRLQNHNYSSLKQLSNEYNVVPSTIYNIKHNKTYYYITIE